MKHNAYDAITYAYGIYDEADELAYNIWEANRILAIAKAEKNKKLASEMKKWLKELGYSLEDSSAEITFVA